MANQSSSLRAVLSPFIQICLLRQGPQDLPTSGILLAIALTAHTVISILLSNMSLSVASALLSGVVDTALLVVLAGVLLYVQRRNTRLIQTLTALAGTATILTTIALPISGWLHGADQAAGEGGFALLLLLIITGWSLAVAGHIYRHALSVPFFVGLVLAVVFYWISVSVFRTLFLLSA
ncbi:MAG: hypothetical protein BMS9Abin01_1849 [Gammaproteobacteria bacterium]|nr:MAG: hypothetical protein BMS9Abin01_1849 [Gammaproteobacteria bacterium]